MKLERQVADIFIKELIEEVEDYIFIDLSDIEIYKRLEDIASDYSDLFGGDEEQLELIVIEAERIATRKLTKKVSDITFQRADDDEGFIVSSIQSNINEYKVHIPGDYTKYWDEDTKTFSNDFPFLLKNYKKSCIYVDETGILLFKDRGFRLEIEREDHTFLLKDEVFTNRDKKMMQSMQRVEELEVV